MNRKRKSKNKKRKSKKSKKIRMNKEIDRQFRCNIIKFDIIKGYLKILDALS